MEKPMSLSSKRLTAKLAKSAKLQKLQLSFLVLLASLALLAVNPFRANAADVPDLSSRIITPPPPAPPRINGPSIYGERTGRPFLYHIPATRDRPITYAVDGLPPGLTLDANSGEITGKTDQSGEFQTTLRPSNPSGPNQQE